MGTTGASMLLIRPLLARTNASGSHVTHTVVFFIFLVSNIGGCLTPLGDPPLFLGYLQGVPFTWTFRLAPRVAVHHAAVLLVYFIWDASTRTARATRATARRTGRRSARCASRARRTSSCSAGVVLACAAFLGALARGRDGGARRALAAHGRREACAQANQFTFHPILEVAARLRRASS